MSQKKAWISRVKTELAKSPLALHMAFGFILACLEKFLEMEFVCPCDPSRNVRFVVLFFLAPALLAFVLTIDIKECKIKSCICNCKECKNTSKKLMKLVSSFVPSIVWIILLLFDGQYVACAKSSQSGQFVVHDSTTHQKLCTAARNITSEELTNTQKWYSESQEIGMWLVFVLVLYVIFYKWCTKEEQDPKKNEPPHQQVSGDQGPEASVSTHEEHLRSHLNEASVFESVPLTESK